MAARYRVVIYVKDKDEAQTAFNVLFNQFTTLKGSNFHVKDEDGRRLYADKVTKQGKKYLRTTINGGE